MSSSAARMAIRDRALSAWPLVHPEVQLFWQNEINDLPDNEPFIFIEIIFDDEEIAAFGGGEGNNELLKTGTIQAHVLVPILTGVDMSDDLAEDFGKIYRFKRFDSVKCLGAAQMGGGRSADNGNFWQQDLVIDFEYRFRG